MTAALAVPAITPDRATLAAALAYAKAGWYVGPVRSGTKDPGSILGKGWQLKSSRDPDVITMWFAGTDHGVFLHAGRSGAVIFDVDHPERLARPIRQAIDQYKPPYQSTRPDEFERGHYIFATPDGRQFGNSLGNLANGWGEIRGANGVIVVAPSTHADGGFYSWCSTGPVPVLPGYLATQLPDAMEAGDAATDVDVAAFLTEHSNPTEPRPELLDIHVQAFQKAVANGESRHDTMPGHLAGAMREAAAGYLDAKLTADTLASVFLQAVARQPTSSRQGRPRTGAIAANEWRGILAWAVGQVRIADLDATRARIAEKFPPLFTEIGAGGGNASELDGQTDDEPPDASETETIKNRFPRLDWHELWADQTEQEYIHDPLLPARRLVAMYSAPKIGKSLLMLEMAVTMSRGAEFLGHTPSKRYRVLYVDYENDPHGDVRTRLQDMRYGPDDLDHLDYLSFPTMAALNSPRGAAELLAAVKAYGSEVVVIDTVSRAIDGEENSNDTWLTFYLHTGLQLKRLGVAMIRLDHSGKDERRGMRGGSAKAGDVDAVWLLTKITDTKLRLECGNTRMRIDTKLLKITRSSEPLRHELEGAEALTTVEAKILELIRLCDDDDLPDDANRDAVREVAKRHGMKVATHVVEEVVKCRKLPGRLRADSQAMFPEIADQNAPGSSGQPA